MDILVIANKNVSVNSVSNAILRGTFLKIRKEWPGGDAVMSVNARDEELRAAFRSNVLKMRASHRHFQTICKQ